MGQAHYGLTSTWHPPSRDMISGLSYVQTRQNSVPALGQMGVAVEGTTGVRPGLFNEGNDLAKPSRDDLAPGFLLPPMDPYGEDRCVGVYARGTPTIEWSAKVQYSWINLTPSSGTLSSSNPDQRIAISVNWVDVPTDFINKNALIYVNSTIGDYEVVRFPVNNTHVPDDFHGFIETDGHVSIEAAHFTSSNTPTDLSAPHYEILPYLGSRTTSSGVALYPVSAPSQNPPDSPYLEYAIYLFSAKSTVKVTLYFTTALATDPVLPLMYAVSFDDTPVNKTGFWHSWQRLGICRLDGLESHRKHMKNKDFDMTSETHYLRGLGRDGGIQLQTTQLSGSPRSAAMMLVDSSISLELPFFSIGKIVSKDTPQ